jgi:hypothetical protein
MTGFSSVTRILRDGIVIRHKWLIENGFGAYLDFVRWGFAVKRPFMTDAAKAS